MFKHAFVRPSITTASYSEDPVPCVSASRIPSVHQLVVSERAGTIVNRILQPTSWPQRTQVSSRDPLGK